jgi:CHASE3 domain sensor protein
MTEQNNDSRSHPTPHSGGNEQTIRAQSQATPDQAHALWEQYQKRQTPTARAGKAALWIGGLMALIVLIISAIIVIQ